MLINQEVFLAAHITRAMQTFLNGTTKQAQYLDIQFANKSEFDDEPVIIDSELLTKATREIEPVVQTSMSFNAVPTETDTVIAVNVVYDRGQKGTPSGLTDAGNFLVNVNGVDLAPVTAVQVGDVYNITVPALVFNDLVKVSINGVQEVIGDALYVSNTIETKVPL